MKVLIYILLVVGGLLTSGFCLAQNLKIEDSTQTKLDQASSAANRVRILINDGFVVIQETPKKGFAYTAETLKDTVHISDPYLLDSLFRFRAFVFGDNNDRKRTLEAHLNRIRVLTKLDTVSKKLASAYFETANVLISQGNEELAYPYLIKCEEVSRQTNYETQLGQVLQNLGEYEFRKENYETAIDYFSESAEIFDNMGRFLFLSGVANANIAEIYAIEGKFSLAEKQIEEALSLADTSERRFYEYTADIFVKAGIVYSKLGKSRKAIDNLLIAQNILERFNKYFYLPHTYKLLAHEYRAIDVDSAFMYLDWYVVMNDSVINKETNDQISQLRFEFEEEQKEQQIAFLEQEKDILSENKALVELENERQSFLIKAGIAVIVVIAVLLLAAIYFFLRSRKQTKVVEQQKQLVEEHNKEIQDSIVYAERIQRAVIPEDNRLHVVFPNSFVFYRPKDVLSGDFYWVYDVITNDQTKLKLFAVGDCTGHGVPGALLSILGVNYLNLGAVNTNINSPAQALDFLNEGIIQTFGHSSDTIRDGMDMVLGAINPNTKEMYYSAAKNNIYIVRGQEIIILKGDKKAIGNDEAAADFKFSDFTVQLQENDMVYAMSDGYQDQFGGPNGKKFKIKQLKELLLKVAALSLEEQNAIIAQTFDHWTEGYEQIDDVSIMGIRV